MMCGSKGAHRVPKLCNARRAKYGKEYLTLVESAVAQREGQFDVQHRSVHGAGFQAWTATSEEKREPLRGSEA